MRSSSAFNASKRWRSRRSWTARASGDGAVWVLSRTCGSPLRPLGARRSAFCVAWSIIDLPPFSTPLPAGRSISDVVLKYFAMTARCVSVAEDTSHMIRKNAIIAVTKSA